MPSHTIKPARHAIRTHRAQIAAEAVVSGYLHEIARPNARPRHSHQAPSPMSIARSRRAPRRPAAFELAA
jgi:hypothetical protein